jgi:hypothetical protein
MRLADLAEVIRSKNAGPFLVTFDIIFASDETFERVRQSASVSRESVAALYRIAPEELIDFAYYGFARSIKFSIRRPQPSGARHDTDVYGAQQHAPLLDLQVAL